MALYNNVSFSAKLGDSFRKTKKIDGAICEKNCIIKIASLVDGFRLYYQIQ